MRHELQNGQPTQVALFVRVSKKSQDYERQIHDLQLLAKHKQWDILTTITEKISGSTNNKDRPAIKELLQLAEQGLIQKVLVTEVSRLGRKTSEVLQVLEHLNELGISVYVNNYNLETLDKEGKRNPIANLLFTFLAEFARMEKETLRERIYSGLERAKRDGKTLGRKKGSVVPADKFLEKHKAVVRQLKQGKSVRDIAAICEVGTATVQKVKKLLDK